jgi:hypothetical protein
MTTRPRTHAIHRLEPTRLGAPSAKRVRFDQEPRDATPPTLRGAPPPPPRGGPPPPAGSPPSGDQGKAKLSSWRGIASALNKDLGDDPSLRSAAWPCFKRFLLGGPVCADGCRKCQKADGKGDEPSRARARAKLASLTASNAIEPGVLAEIKAGENGRA